MPSIVKVTIAITVHNVIDLAVHSCSSVTNSIGGSVTKCCSGVVYGLVISVL